MLRVYVGAVLVVAGIAGLIEAHSHRPQAHARLPDFKGSNILGTLTLTSPSSSWSQTAYDLARIGASAVIVLGAVAVVLGVVRERSRTRILGR